MRSDSQLQNGEEGVAPAQSSVIMRGGQQGQEY